MLYLCREMSHLLLLLLETRETLETWWGNWKLMPHLLYMFNLLPGIQLLIHDPSDFRETRPSSQWRSFSQLPAHGRLFIQMHHGRQGRGALLSSLRRCTLILNVLVFIKSITLATYNITSPTVYSETALSDKVVFRDKGEAESGPCCEGSLNRW